MATATYTAKYGATKEYRAVLPKPLRQREDIPMEVRKYTNLEAFNKFRMSEFRLHSIEYATSGPFQNAVVIASRGYMEHFGAELKFLDIKYIASECFFSTSILRLGELQELPVAREYAECNLYCFEDVFSLSDEMPQRQYFVAKNVEITVHYAGKNIEDVFRESDQIERK